MTPRQRVCATFEGRPTDKVPVHHISSSSQVASLILGRDAYVGGDIQQWREARALWQGEQAHAEFLERSLQDAFDVSAALGHDLLRLHYWRLPQKPTKKIDAHTYLYGDPEGDWHVRRFDAETELFSIIDRSGPEPALANFEALEKSVAQAEEAADNFRPTPKTFADIQQCFDRYGEQYAIRVAAGFIHVPYPAIWIEATLARPDLVTRLLDTQLARAIKSVDVLCTMGVRLFFGGGDFASNQGPFYSPATFHELMLPRLQRFAAACHARGAQYLFASDGDLWPVAEDLLGASGVDGYYEIDRRAGMDLRKLRARFPNLTLLGNISSQTLHVGSRKAVIDETRSCIDAAKECGRIIVGTSNLLMPGTPAENVMAMIQTIQTYR